MYGFYNFDEIPQKFSPNLNTDWKKRGETLTWVLISYTDDEVTLKGPGNSSGIFKVCVKDFQNNWIRA